MGKNQSASGLTNIIHYDNNGNITFVSGSTTLMAISSSGAITTTGVISGSSAANAVSASFASVATSASFASNAANAISSSFATTSLTSSFANNLTVAGTITAQTLNVQQVTSSVIYSSGSNVFGNSLLNTQVFTGSVYMNTNGLFVSSSGLVGIGTINPSAVLTVVYTSGSSGIFTPIGVTAFNATTNVGGTATSYGGLTVSNALDTTITIRSLGSGHAQISTDAAGRYLSFGTGNFIERVRITAGGQLQINGASGNASITTDSTANVIGMYTNTSVVDGIARIEVTGDTYPSTPNTAFIRANTVRFTLNAAGTETMRITSSGDVNINGGSFNLHNGYLRLRNSAGTSTYGLLIQKAIWVGSGTDYSPSLAAETGYGVSFFTNGTADEKVRISTSGVVTKPYQPLAMGAMPGDQFVPATTFTTISFQTNYGFNQANVGSSWNNSSNYFTAPATGIYLINAGLYTNNVGQIAAFINGTRTISMVANGASFPTTWHGTMMIKMNAGEVLTLRGYGDGGGYVYQNTYHSWFGIYFLG